MRKKIDDKLLQQISIMSQDCNVLCYVFSKDIFAAKALFRLKKIRVENEYLFISAFLCSMKRSQIFDLSKLDVVEAICSSTTASAQIFVSKKILSCQNLKLTGKGVGVAFIDTGLSPHCDFLIGKPRVELFRDFISGKSDLYDDNGHGTFVCGVCSGAGVLSNFRYAGIAPKSRIFALKALNQDGEASANKILDAMEWVFDNHKRAKIDVVCMSFGSEPLGSNDPIMLGANALWNDGVVVVAAAGNSGPEYQTIKSPGVCRKVITVGGIDDKRKGDIFDRKNFEMAEFSSRGPAMRQVKPDVVAPCVDIISCGMSDFYTTLSGTSVSTPMIAGLTCLILEKYPSFSPDQVKNMLLRTCESLGFEKNFEGYGLPNCSKI